MEYKLYQTEWNNVNLKAISRELHMPQESIAASDFYDAFYKKLSLNGFCFDEGWLEEKKKTSELIKRVLKKIEKENTGICNKNMNIISLGCGTGVVECGLIEEGYKVELQECQSHSLGYLYKNGISPQRIWITKDLEEIPQNSYDVVIIVFILYVFDAGGVYEFLEKARKLLKTNGRMIIVEGLGQLDSMLAYCKQRSIGKKNNGVFWGYLRNLYALRKLIRKAGLGIEGEFAIDDKMQFIKKKPKTFLGFPSKNSNVKLWGWISKK